MKKPTIWISLSIFILIIVAWFITPIILVKLFNTPTDRGLFGDSFGALNSLFSGLAFAGLVVAILLQRSELELQREELKLTRKEVKASAEAQKESSNFLGEQSEILKVTAELNGLAALIQAQTEQINFLRHKMETRNINLTNEIDKLDKDRESNIHNLELLMHAVFCASEVDYR